MANIEKPRAVSHAAPSVAGNENLLRPLKNLLQARFPTVRSSHLTEAIAAGLGHKSHAAFLADPPFAGPWRALLIHKSFEPEPFRQRLAGFGYPIQADFRFDRPAPTPMPPKQYLDWLSELRELNRYPGGAGSRISALHKNCAEMFAGTFELGRLEDRDDKAVKVRWKAGIDHGACLPNWGAVVNATSRSWIEFPGTDHERRFYQNLPLTSGKIAQYQSGAISMPYKDASIKMDEIAVMVGRIGWTCSHHPEWSWHAPGETTLLLFKRSTPHTLTLHAWQRSFKRWIVESRAKLLKRAGVTRRKVIEDIAACQHLPLDLVDFEDCHERYIKEFVSDLYDEERPGMALIFRRLMEQWAQELGQLSRGV
ncbi:hypothetical protein [Polaromonas sp.]|uniref:hypothetical protein n=1 Tax=Polaromonas sp. TaxID=1869339 RepID=UPI003BAD0CF2